MKLLLYMVVVAVLSACHAKPNPLRTELWVPDDGSFSVNVPQKPNRRPLGNGTTYYLFDSPEPHGGHLLEVQVDVKSPYQPPIYKTDAFYDLYERAYRGERGAVVNRTNITNNGYRGMQLSITAGPHSPKMIRILSTDHRNYIVQWDPTVPHTTEIADTFVIPQGATQP